MDSKIGTHGGDLKHIYTQDGEIKESNGNLNKETTTSGVKTGGDKLVKMESGTWSTSTQSKGSDTANAITPVVLSNGQIVPTTKSSGSTVKPVYVDDGAIKPITGSKGNDTRPVYLDNGEIKETTFPQADVVGVDAQHKVIKTTVGDGLKVESNTLKVNYGNGIKLDTSDPKKIIADITVSPSYTTGTPVANVKVGTTDGIIKVPTATSSQLGLVKNGSNINNSSGTLSVPHAGDNLSNPGVLKTVKGKTVVGTDDNGNLKAATVTTGTSDDTTIASKGYVDDNTPAAGKLIVVDSSAAGGRKIHVDVEDALKNSGSDVVKDADMVGIKNDKIAKVTVSNGLEKDSSNNLKVKAHTDITVTANGVAANNMRPLAGTNTTVGGTDNRQVNVATANGANLGVVKQGTNVTIKSDGSVNVPTAGGATDPAGVIKSVKNADFVGTDANGQLVARDTPEKFVVAFRNSDYTLLGICSVKPGNAATAPANPTPPAGYNFAGWDRAYNNVTTDLLVTATYSIKQYTVTFVDWNGTQLKQQTVNHGANATPPANPTRTGYNFTGWNGAYTNVTSNRTITAQYTIQQFTVTFNYYSGTTAKTTSQTVNYNGSATAPTDTTRTGYTFDGWDKTFNNVTSNMTVTAKYTVISHTVKFYNNAAKTKLLWTGTVNHGGTVDMTIPAIDGLTADTWRLVSGSNAYGSGITEDTEYAASYKLTWSGQVDIDGGAGSSDYSYSTYVIGAANTIGTTTRYKDLGTDNYGFTIKITELSGYLKHSASPNHKLKWGINLDTDGLQAGASSWSDVHSETVVGTIASEWRHTFVQEPLQTNSNATMNFSIAPTRSVDYSFYDSGYESDRLITNLTTDKSKDSKIRITMWAVKADSCTAKWTINVTNLVLEFT